MKKKSPKRRTINVTGIYDASMIATSTQEMLWEFESDAHRIRLHLPYWWLMHLPEKLWQAIKAQEDRIDRAKQRMKGETS